MNSHKKQQEHIFKNMKEYMFTNDNIIRFNRSIFNTNNSNNSKSKKEKKGIVQNKDSDIFYPSQQDELFWCFFIALKGKDYYTYTDEKSFTFEKNFKINSIELLREKKDLLKSAKIKKNLVEDELANSKYISVSTLHALCIIYKVSIIYVWGKKYSTFIYGDTPEYIIISDATQKKTGIRENIKETDIKQIYDAYWYIEEFNKQLKGLSSYNMNEIHDICKRLELKIIDNSGKKINKKTLYEKIKEYL
jgi:hypothetical protein